MHTIKNTIWKQYQTRICSETKLNTKLAVRNITVVLYRSDQYGQILRLCQVIAGRILFGLLFRAVAHFPGPEVLKLFLFQYQLN